MDREDRPDFTLRPETDLDEGNTFTDVTEDLGERRPDANDKGVFLDPQTGDPLILP
ncbi:MAG: hypothetical protein ABWY93_18610 [Mycobacterium sp.]